VVATTKIWVYVSETPTGRGFLVVSNARPREHTYSGNTLVELDVNDLGEVLSQLTSPRQKNKDQWEFNKNEKGVWYASILIYI